MVCDPHTLLMRCTYWTPLPYNNTPAGGWCAAGWVVLDLVLPRLFWNRKQYGCNKMLLCLNSRKKCRSDKEMCSAPPGFTVSWFSETLLVWCLTLSNLYTPWRWANKYMEVQSVLQKPQSRVHCAQYCLHGLHSLSAASNVSSAGLEFWVETWWCIKFSCGGREDLEKTAWLLIGNRKQTGTTLTSPDFCSRHKYCSALSSEGKHTSLKWLMLRNMH